ncbi:GDP-mannose 4,6-dehydratase, partial [Candidatus Pelagibacter bacterium]|nr:GDP-mannose 4,6-dehydratase [Candidatus Pelagibacter bacterium]
GSHFVDLLLNKGHKVFGASRSKEPHNVFLPYKKSIYLSNFKFIKFDINKDVPFIKKLIIDNKISYIINFSAQSMVGQSWENPIDWYNTNVLGTINFLNNIKKIKHIKKYVHISTPEVYGATKKNLKETRSYSPSTPYAISRATCDMHLYSLYKNYNFPVIFTRAANVYGPGQQLYRIVPKAILSLKLKRKLFLDGGGKSKRSFIYISDVANATYALCLKSTNGEIYHISTNQLVSIKQLVKMIFKLKNRSISEFVKLSSERVGKDSLYSLNSNKIRKETKWKPKVSLTNGLIKTIQWAEKNIKILKKKPNTYIHKK